MKPLYPARFRASDIADKHWAELPENITFYRHIRNVCLSFPSLILAFSARPGLSTAAAEIAKDLAACGINVFMPNDAVPICALSQALGSRNLPLGLYLDADDTGDNFTLAAMTSHGGPFDMQDVIVAPFGKSTTTGVVGETDLLSYYAANLAGFADQYIEKGIGFSALDIPFPALIKKLKDTPGLEILFQADPHGPAATLSPDGQALKIFEREKGEIASEEIAMLIADYLSNERLASGTIIGPSGRLTGFSRYPDRIEVEGTLVDLNHRVGFTDLLVGWWPDGSIAHQGNSCFGDGLLSAIYFLEAKRN